MAEPVKNEPVRVGEVTGRAEVGPSDPRVRNNRIAAGIYLAFQAATIALFAIFVRPQAYQAVIDNGLFEAVGTALLVLVGKA
jgi:hypothetical protein